MNPLIDHVGIVCSDLPRSTAFYTHLLEATVTPLGGHTVVAAGGVHIALVPRRDGDPSTPGWGHHLCIRLHARDRPALVSRLASLGSRHEEVEDRLYTHDPDGFVLELVFA